MFRVCGGRVSPAHHIPNNPEMRKYLQCQCPPQLPQLPLEHDPQEAEELPARALPPLSE